MARTVDRTAAIGVMAKVVEIDAMISARLRFQLFALPAALLLPLAGASAGPAPDGYDAQTRAGIQRAVKGQLDAFARGDASGAEAFAAPAIRDRFPDPAAFMSMVRTQYAALIKPRSTQFGGVAPSPHGPLQKVTVVAADGTVWSAIYSFAQVGGQWRITGCGLEKDDSQQEI